MIFECSNRPRWVWWLLLVEFCEIHNITTCKMSSIVIKKCRNLAKFAGQNFERKNITAKSQEFAHYNILGLTKWVAFLKEKYYNRKTQLSNTRWNAEIPCFTILKSRTKLMKYLYLLYCPMWYDVKWNFGRKKKSYLYFSKEFSTTM